MYLTSCDVPVPCSCFFFFLGDLILFVFLVCVRVCRLALHSFTLWGQVCFCRQQNVGLSRHLPTFRTRLPTSYRCTTAALSRRSLFVCGEPSDV